jgi:hypothetical protein
VEAPLLSRVSLRKMQVGRVQRVKRRIVDAEKRMVVVVVIC